MNATEASHDPPPEQREYTRGVHTRQPCLGLEAGTVHDPPHRPTMAPDTVADAFRHRLERAPGSPVVVCSGQACSTADLDALARDLEHRLDAAGLAPGTLVALATGDGPAFLASLLAIRRGRRAALLLGSATPEAIATARRLGARALLAGTGWPQSAEDLTLTALATEAEAPDLAPDTAVVKLTSGSTGRPRGIVVPATAMAADEDALARTMGLEWGERILAGVPFSHSYGLSSVALPALARGATLILPRPGGGPFASLRAAHEHGATFFPTVPAYLQALLKLAEPPSWPDSLRLTITAGAPLRPETAARFREVYDRRIHVFYGASECGGICYDREGGAGERSSLGTPVEGVEICLEPEVEGETGTDGPGLVTVRSAAVAAGYLGDSGEPTTTGPGLAGGRFRTSDLGELRRGELHLLGRVDDVINLKGKKVHPREVEAVLRELAAVEDVAVLEVPRPGAEPLLRAVVACLPGALSREDVLAWCRPRLAEHKIPRSVVLVQELPRTERGKLDRRALRQLEHG